MVLYFDNWQKQQKCINLSLKQVEVVFWSVQLCQEFPVGEAKPALVTIYDYYNTDDRWVSWCTCINPTV